MTPTLRLATLDQVTTYDLYAGTLRVQEGSWETRTPSGRSDFKGSMFGGAAKFQSYDRVTETLALIGSDTVANLLTAVNAIEAFQERARLWHNDPVQDVSSWLEFNADGESARRSLIYDLALSYPQMTGVSALLSTAKLAARLAIIRHPLWESVAADSYTTPTLDCLGGQLAIAPAAGSTAPGRMPAFYVNGVSGSGPLATIWAGIRETYETVTGFVSKWECESGTPGTDAAVAGETGASPSGSSNNKIQVTFVTTANAKRLTLTVNQIAPAAATAQIGRYVVLCRCKVSAGGTVALQLRTGNVGMADADLTQNEVSYVTETAWKLVELGEFQIPPVGWRGYRSATDHAKYTQAQIWAEVVSGSGVTLDLDCLILIPAGAYVKLEGAAVQYAPGSPTPYTYPAAVYTDENDVNAAIAYLSATSPAASLKPTIRDWYCPAAGGVLVLAAERSTGGVLGDLVYPVLYVYKRWLSFRAA
jgi:hypothetical protein